MSIEAMKQEPAYEGEPDMHKIVSRLEKRTFEMQARIDHLDFELRTAQATPPAQPAPVQDPVLVIAARKVMEELGTSTDSLQELYQALKSYSTQPAAPVQEPNEADELLRHLGLDPQTCRTDGGAINRMKVKAALAHPDEYPRMGSMDAMVNRFLTWPVPASVYPDGTPGQPGRTGTNLLTADEARQMLEHVVGTPPAAQRQWVGLTDEQVEKLFRRWCKNNAYTTTLVEFKKAYCYIDAELREKNGGAA